MGSATTPLRLHLATQLQRWKGLDSFFGFCIEEGILKSSPLEGIKRPKDSKARRPPKLTDDDIDLLLSVCTRWTWMGLRDQAIIMTLWTTPFRLSEIAGLRVEDVDFREFSLRTIQGKGGVAYGAVLFPNCAQALDRYLNKRPFNAGALFLNQDGEPMTPHALQQMLRRLEKKSRVAGFQKHIYAHAFRHAFGMRTVQWGLALDEAARSMGQRSEAAAKIYRQWSLEEQALAKIRRIAG